MAKNYYSLVAGLREYTIDGDRKGFDTHAILSEIESELNGSDSEALKLLYTYYDLCNIISHRNESSGNDLGNIPRKEIADELKSPKRLPKEIANVIITGSEGDESSNNLMGFERTLFDSYYQLCAKSSSRFLREWSEFDRNLRNICAAFTARRFETPIDEAVVGDGYVVDALLRSSASDFGLKGEISYIDSVLSAVSDEGDIINKEHKVDNIRWEMSDELIPFDYFNINTILAYLVKINIIHRWVSLDRAKGEEMLNKLIMSFDESENIKRANQEDQ